MAAAAASGMITNYFTLQALVRDWQPMIDYRIGEAYSQSRGELTLALYRSEHDPEWSLKAGTVGPQPYVFRYPGHNRPRRNVTPLLEECLGRSIVDIALSRRDRFLRLALEDRRMIEIMPFGPHANVFLLNADRTIVHAFRNGAALEGRPAPAPRPAPELPTDVTSLADSMAPHRGTVSARLSRAIPLFDRVMSREVCYRAGIADDEPPGEEGFERLLRATHSFVEELNDPAPRIYRKDGRAVVFALGEMRHLAPAFTVERHESVDDGVRTFVRASLGARAFDREHAPLLTTLERETSALKASLERMEEELTRPSRADAYEHYGHLLMAHQTEVPTGVEEAQLNDLFGDGSLVHVPLDPDLTPIQNAQRYYDRARRTRQARDHAERRFTEQAQRLLRLEEITEAVREVRSLKELHVLREREEDFLAAILQHRSGTQASVPYRQFDIGGYEVLVGRSARHNDRLTFGVARKFDLWLHARGVPGSHVVVRRDRTDHPPPSVMQRAAGLAAWFSKARGSSMVPVIVAERKYVRSVRGGPPGAVIVEREEVMMVEPISPEDVAS